jgi:ACT domain-containing protein
VSVYYDRTFKGDREMKEKWNLSDFIYESIDLKTGLRRPDYIKVKDVTEFVRRLKEEISQIFYNCKDECGMTDLIIDKLAGDKLKETEK